MGICSSCESTSVVTAKVILQDGQLQEFSYPVKVSYVLMKNPSCFICNSDEMEFDDQLSAINDDEELQPGQLYFALPLSKLRYPLTPEEMASLAVKASSALMKCGGGHNRRQVAPVTFTVSERKTRREMTNVGGGNCGRLVAEKRKTKSGGRGRNFTSMLGAIPE
ncbi:Protein of unknown function DUF4228 [Macleaya cordata]|uniref:Uncharacterized protein n=1 Tax=Macleaya cordata TaxID=56857 RepID=A0A200R7E7_MACCD|nr:Protein of unknown function DUF4228 [Macleaya cordata]